MDKKISQLGATSVPANPDLFAIVQSGTTKKIAFQDIKSALLNSASLTAGTIPYWDGTNFADSPFLLDSGDIVLSALIKSPDLNSIFALYGGTNGGTIVHYDGTINSYLLADSNSATVSWSDGADFGNLLIDRSRTLINHNSLIEFDSPAYQYVQLTASTVPYLDASKNLVSSAVTPTELGYLSGTTSDIQTQIDFLLMNSLKSLYNY